MVISDCIPNISDYDWRLLLTGWLLHRTHSKHIIRSDWWLITNPKKNTSCVAILSLGPWVITLEWILLAVSCITQRDMSFGMEHEKAIKPPKPHWDAIWCNRGIFVANHNRYGYTAETSRLPIGYIPRFQHHSSLIHLAWNTQTGCLFPSQQWPVHVRAQTAQTFRVVSKNPGVFVVSRIPVFDYPDGSKHISCSHTCRD